jgi:predicted nucleic acid-binding protein
VIVLDASAAVGLVVGGEHGDWVEGIVAGEDVHAPHLLDLEVANVLRGLVRAGVLAERRALLALEDLTVLAVHRYSHVPFLGRIWALRRNLSAYDAAYVALAEALGAPLVTTDARHGSAPTVRTTVLSP